MSQNSANAVENSAVENYGSAAFQKKYLWADLQAGVITATMAIPLSIGIALMSDYPIQVGLATVAFAALIGFLFAWFRPGNYIGAPGIPLDLLQSLHLELRSLALRTWHSLFL